MTSFKQIEANRLNALRSTGPRTEEGKQRSRLNALRHGLTATTVVSALENAADYAAFEQSILADYSPQSATARELTSRLASVLWRLRRSTNIETGLLQIQGELMRSREASMPLRKNRRPEWYDELDVAATGDTAVMIVDEASAEPNGLSQKLAYCYLQVSRLQFGAFETLSRYETALWRQAAQLIFMLQSAERARDS
jgi:hypothetical protein